MSEDQKPHVNDDPHDPVAFAPDAATPELAAASPEAEFAASEADLPLDAVAASDHAVEAHAEPEVVAADPEPVVHGAGAHDPVAEIPSDIVRLEPEPDPVPTPVEPAPADAAPIIAATAATAVTTSGKPPIWSDHGDAPFDDGDEPLTLKDRPIKNRDIKGPKPDRPSEPSAGSELLEIVKTIVFALLIAFVLRVLLFQPFTIPSASMEPNLYEGDYIIVSKWSYGYSKFSSGLPVNLPLGEGRVFGSAPARGDIVVFKLPRDDRTDYIKRVIGLPGDQIQMIANKLYINGTAVQDVVIGESEAADVFGPRSVVQARETLPNGKSFDTQDFGPGGDLDDTGVYEVPAGYYFMMGDNRDNSIDSRVEQSSGVGFVPAQNLVGKAQIIAFSWEPGASLWNPVTWFSNIRPSRFFRVLD